MIVGCLNKFQATLSLLYFVYRPFRAYYQNGNTGTRISARSGYRASSKLESGGYHPVGLLLIKGKTRNTRHGSGALRFTDADEHLNEVETGPRTDRRLPYHRMIREERKNQRSSMLGSFTGGLRNLFTQERHKIDILKYQELDDRNDKLVQDHQKLNALHKELGIHQNRLHAQNQGLIGRYAELNRQYQELMSQAKELDSTYNALQKESLKQADRHNPKPDSSIVEAFNSVHQKIAGFIVLGVMKHQDEHPIPLGSDDCFPNSINMQSERFCYNKVAYRDLLMNAIWRLFALNLFCRSMPFNSFGGSFAEGLGAIYTRFFKENRKYHPQEESLFPSPTSILSSSRCINCGST